MFTHVCIKSHNSLKSQELCDKDSFIFYVIKVCPSIVWTFHH